MRSTASAHAINPDRSILDLPSVNDKLATIEAECHQLLTGTFNAKQPVPLRPARDISLQHQKSLPQRIGLQRPEGQARLLHDLANVELQAMELGIRTLREFPNTPVDFRAQLVDVILEEARHLHLCLRGIENLGFQWGHWPIHATLWDSTDASDSLLDRILIVHCYLEASGLDSGEALLQRLTGVTNRITGEIVKTIAHEEEGHVRFGLNWYRSFTREANLNPADDFSSRLRALAHRIPARAAKIAEKPRQRAGFTDAEISAIRDFSELKISESRAAATDQQPAGL